MIKLKRLEIKNFKSIVSETIDFNDFSGLKFLGGENLKEPRLGANAAGKSSIWESLFWCLYGKTPRGGKRSIVSSWGADKTEVSVYLEISYGLHVVCRSGPPTKILLNEKIVGQHTINDLLGLNETEFKHSVMFGQGVPLLPDLSYTERGDLLNKVLDLEYWTNCSYLSGTKATEHTANMERVLSSIEKEKAKVEGLADILSLERKSKAWEGSIKEEIGYLEAESNKWDAEKKDSIDFRIAELEAAEKLASRDISTERYYEEELKKKYDEANSLELKVSGDYITKIKEKNYLESIIKFWSENKECPTCASPINPEEYTSSSVARLSVVDKEVAISKALLEEISNLKKEAGEKHLATAIIVNNFIKEIDFAKGKVITLDKDILEKIKKENPYDPLIEKKRVEENPYLEDIAELKERISIITKNINELNEKFGVITSELDRMLYWKAAFNRIRLALVEKAILTLEIEINSAAYSLGLVGWKINILTEFESDSGSVKLGVIIKVTPPDKDVGSINFEAWSGGESQRLRLAIALGLSSLIKRKAGVNFNFEVWDEPTTWLGNEGVEDLLATLQHRAGTQNKSIWIIDHRALTSTTFKEIWIARKDHYGTKVYKI